ncbi:hypothetical protein ABEF92_006196 [Exophiala dermatitidis]|uniref:DUF7624 domain-containing protein n=1 Tax=Exophiala dermatitidis (strain ATCC 34100 / CBS 525.76 / NIH/UT8656) TaxID=858893 RepID=H6C0P4_EXODN|nr:uncharacterized protein HMPREF1120_05329 [Exophiala dermatitidis NIH/UT8656]EHY57286.1 hypothetical protein HMPREF1120_05329 [Exophiala dermatitidis NIH/UT8656]
MMAVRAPLPFSPSTNALFPTFSPFPEQPDSPRPRSAAPSGVHMSVPERPRTAGENQLKSPVINSITSPRDPVAPSPVNSDVTNFEDVDQEVEEDDTDGGSTAGNSFVSGAPQNLNDIQRAQIISPLRNSLRGITTPLKLDTQSIIDQQIRARVEEETEPQSAIHIPTEFGKFPPTRTPAEPPRQQDKQPSRSKPEDQLAEQPKEAERSRAGSTDSKNSESTVTESATLESNPVQKPHGAPMPPTPLQTSLPPLPIHDWSRTPRAQTRQDLNVLSRPGSSLASILEGDTDDHPSTDETGDEGPLDPGFLRGAEAELNALRNALSECWTLCNTLASLSHIHRERIFNFSGRGDMHEQAWKACWKLCQNLYETREDSGPNSFSHNSSRPTLDLCRDFCQALFEVRVRDNETADSVLRVSFELNNHLFNTHDRSLPEAFRERTLDFYITLCHRLMKQKSKMAEETDSLLRACWSLAEMLFSLRQNRREGKKPDEELLGSAILACWELCDLFREGWTRIRPERGTPRPSQTTFTQAFHQAKRSGFAPLDENMNPRLLPETPTTIFEDTVTTISPDEAPTPNIVVLRAEEASRMSTTSSVSSFSAGPYHRQPSPNFRNPLSAQPGPTSANYPRWSANSSTFSLPASAISEGGPAPASATTVSTVRTPAEDPTLILLKALFVKAALATGLGYSQSSGDPNLNSLHNFVKNLPDTAFGNQAWQMSLLENYRKAIMNDSGFRNLGTAGTVGERGKLNSVEVGRAVMGMTSCVYGFGWLRDLYRYVFGYYAEEALKANSSHTAGGAGAGDGTHHPGRRQPAAPGKQQGIGVTAAVSLVAAVMDSTNNNNTGNKNNPMPNSATGPGQHAPGGRAAGGGGVGRASSRGSTASNSSGGGSASGKSGTGGRRTVSQ